MKRSKCPKCGQLVYITPRTKTNQGGYIGPCYYDSTKMVRLPGFGRIRQWIAHKCADQLAVV